MTSRFHVDPRGILVATWKIFVDAFIIVVCVSGRVGEPSLKSPSVVEEGEKRVYIARLPSLPFPRLTMRFMPALKRFSQKKRVRVNVDGATRRGEGQGWRARNDLGNDLQFLFPAVSAFFSSYAKR